MKMSTRGRYGVNAMFELALRYGEGPSPIRNIAKAQNIPMQYLEQLLAQLRKAGLIESVRGAQGGYKLASAPQEITIGQIVCVLEGPVAVVDCLQDGVECSRANENNCAGRIVWENINGKINDVFNQITLQDLLTELQMDRG